MLRASADAAPLPQSALEEAAGDIQKSKAAEACTILREYLKTHAPNARAWNLLGVAEAERKHSTEAEGAFRTALKLDARLLAANENLGLLLFQKSDFAGAARYLGNAADLASRRPAVRFNLGVALLRSGQAQAARNQFVGLEAAWGNSASYWEERGTAELAVKSFRAAASSFDKALKIAPGSVRALNGAAIAAECQHDLDKAVALLVRARQASPEDVTTLVNFGRVCVERDLDDDAVEALTRVRSLAPENHQALYLLASAHLALEHYQASRDLLAEFVDEVPSYPTTYYALGWIDVKLNRLESARQEFEQCLRLSPQFQDAIYELAELDLRDNRLDAAEAGFRKVLALNPAHAKAAVGLGDTLIRRGQIDQAQALYKQAIRSKPDWGAAHYKLAMLLLKKYDKTRGERERALADELNKKESLDSRTRLKILWPGGGPAEIDQLAQTEGRIRKVQDLQ